MASLTDQLPTITTGKPIIDPGPEGPSWLSALADFGTNAVRGAVQINQDVERNRARRQQERREAALDSTAGALHELMRAPTDTSLEEAAKDRLNSVSPQISPFAPELAGEQLPSDVIAGTRELERARAAHSQGRISQATLDMRLEALVSSLMQKYPDMQQEIADYVQGRGFQHYMYRGAQLEQAMASAERDASVNSMQAMANVAIEAGLIADPSMPIADMAEIGRQVVSARQQAEHARQAWEMAQADERMNRERREEVRREASQRAQAAAMTEGAVGLDGLLSAATAALSAAGNDAARQAMIGELQQTILGNIATFERRGIAQINAAGGDPDTIRAFQTQVQESRDSLNQLFTQSFEQNSRALRNIEASFRLDTATALPLYSRLVDAIGQPAANMLFTQGNGLIEIAPHIVESIREELNNPLLMAQRGASTINRLVQYLRGQEGLQDLTPEQAQQYMRTNERSLFANQNAILEDGQTSLIPNWISTYSNVIEAGVEFPPTLATVDSLHHAFGMVGGRDARRIIAMIPDESQRLAVAQGSRAATARIFEIAKNNLPQNYGPFTMAYNNGRYEAVLTRDAYNEYERTLGVIAAGSPGGVAMRGLIPSYEEMRRQIPQGLRQHLAIMNGALQHMIDTHRYDQNLPGNMTPRQIRDLWALNRMPEGMSRGDDSRSSDEQFNDLIQNLRAAADDLLVRQIAAPIPSSFIVGPESGGDPNARNPNSSAAGLGQFITSTWMDRDLRQRAGFGDVPDAEWARMRSGESGREAQVAMINAYAQRNAERWREVFGSDPTPGQIYGMHFLDSEGFIRLAQMAQSNPSTNADDIFPAAARANRRYFYKQDGSPRTARELYQFLQNVVENRG